MSIEQKHKLYNDFLIECGFLPTKIDNCLISFKLKEKTYCIQMDAQDEIFLRLCYPNFYKLDTAEKKRDIPEICESVNREIKCAKLFAVNDNLLATVELLLATPELFKPVFFRCLSILQTAEKTFIERASVIVK